MYILLKELVKIGIFIANKYTNMICQRTSTLLLIALYLLFIIINLLIYVYHIYYTIGNTLPTYSKLTNTVHLVFLKQYLLVIGGVLVIYA